MRAAAVLHRAGGSLSSAARCRSCSGGQPKKPTTRQAQRCRVPAGPKRDAERPQDHAKAPLLVAFGLTAFRQEKRDQVIFGIRGSSCVMGGGHSSRTCAPKNTTMRLDTQCLCTDHSDGARQFAVSMRPYTGRQATGVLASRRDATFRQTLEPIKRRINPARIAAQGPLFCYLSVPALIDVLQIASRSGCPRP